MQNYHNIISDNLKFGKTCTDLHDQLSENFNFKHIKAEQFANNSSYNTLYIFKK